MLSLQKERPINYDVYHHRSTASRCTAAQRRQRAQKYARILEEHAENVLLAEDHKS